MGNLPAQCTNLKEQVELVLQLLQQEILLRSQDITSVQTSLGKAISPRFEIVFAGAFSAGKSMLINALLERELLYSAEGHATGTECKIEYAELGKEGWQSGKLKIKVTLEFTPDELNLSETESPLDDLRRMINEKIHE